ncbi:MAG: glycerol dehydratase reactivase beta/small subunit family protein [Treponema sp.]|jgi:hypothetical protein|nr:glycerol dehydratase reactivase beta/small subunit family protein [Treponema sp.]
MLSQTAVPSIKLYANSDLESPELVQEILCGAEEEGVPCELDASAEGAAVVLAFRAALDSVLGVGIGIDSKGTAAVHYSKLPENSPLFTLNYRIDGEKLRGLASNAARLVKGMPFVL